MTLTEVIGIISIFVIVGMAAWGLEHKRISEVRKRVEGHEVLIGSVQGTLNGLGDKIELAVTKALMAHEERENGTVHVLNQSVTQLATQVAVLNKIVGNGGSKGTHRTT